MSDTLLSVSLYFILIPTAASLLTLRHSRLSAVMFMLFVLGIVTEQIMLHDRPLGEQVIFDVYCLAECAIFLWIVLAPHDGPSYRRFLIGLLLIVLPSWLFFIFIIPTPLPVNGQYLTGSGLFNSLYQVCIAYMAAAKLLKIIEMTQTPYEAPIFWIVLGIFVYCFGTFFEMIFLWKKLLAQEIWYIHNIINIVTYIIYSIGLAKVYEQKKHVQKPSP
ncbi:hypothetical protein KK062_26140 [Fulvivirgaceae bacterium PWU5]|uniref:Uncharacterized protein n=1 Tax=Dawidia cretensis TaxID=2782350 RepID=A0AAP2GT27_9BACT|nr:hypothetical protein [Dawidia cretensis]MBT1711749.1 hypothetical protein [Dawidia cretensis]